MAYALLFQAAFTPANTLRVPRPLSLLYSAIKTLIDLFSNLSNFDTIADIIG